MYKTKQEKTPEGLIAVSLADIARKDEAIDALSKAIIAHWAEIEADSERAKKKGEEQNGEETLLHLYEGIDRYTGRWLQP